MADEKVDIDEARQKEILELSAKLGQGNYFEVLGVPPGSPPDACKRAFHEASKKFHPDRYFGKNLGSFRARLDTLFKALVEANSVLSDPERRAAWLKQNPHFARAEAKPEPVRERNLTEQERDAERRARLTRHPYLAKVGKLQETLARAKAHIARGEFEHAYTMYNMASQIDPDNQEIRAALVEIRKKNELSRSNSELARAKKALEAGDEDTGISALRSSLASNALNGEAAYKLAVLLEKRGAAGQELFSIAQKAVDAEPKNIEYRLLLARALEKAGMKVNAKVHFDEAVKLNPEHPEVKKQVKKRWPF